MHELAMQFAQHCESSFDLTTQSEYGYQSLSVCILDCIYSLRAKYYAVTIPIVERYANLYMNGDSQAPGDTVSMLLQRMDEIAHQTFVEKVVQNHQKLGGRTQIPKEDVCYMIYFLS